MIVSGSRAQFHRQIQEALNTEKILSGRSVIDVMLSLADSGAASVFRNQINVTQSPFTSAFAIDFSSQFTFRDYLQKDQHP